MSKLYLERLFEFHLCRCEFKRKQNKKQKNLKGKKFSINKKKLGCRENPRVSDDILVVEPKT